MNNPLVTTLFTVGGAFIGSLLGIFLTPQLQYRIWRHRQRLELKRTVIRDMQKVTTEYLYKYSATNHLPFSERYRPREESEPDFVQSLRIVVDNIKCLF